jgi:rhamnulose-1-phosphate aldolase
MLHNFLNEKTKKIIIDAQNICEITWQKEWAESNAGNISIDITKDIKSSIFNYEQEETSIMLDRDYPLLSNAILLITGSGRRLRDLSKNFLNHSCIVKINQYGNKYSILKFNENDYTISPSSELISHLRIHENMRKYKPDFKAILHTHPPEIVAITHNKDFLNQTSLNNLLSFLLPEINTFFPEGIGFVEYETPGSIELAEKTTAALLKHNVLIWEKHGCISMGKDINDAFDKTDMIIKALKIYFLCKIAGYQPDGFSISEKQ